MAKPEHEFHPITDIEYTECPGGNPLIKERILAKDEETGVATRILRYEPGADSLPMGQLTHDFWEEVYIIEGSFVDLSLNQTFSAGDFAIRPPGMPHGPWKTDEGVLTFESRYYSR
ncbi:hypothetical protein nbrc107696_41080 [Gordonia spumicola]|uniref:ChrR-like cupin domain-containing protein n=1 Tax=Gordonia spumicola TaxID=589161 RepID=A0A7I9VEK9_9ACTN|nr:cupin domain-containing protein [Gordonia spumicola]GEE03662.1 hypothetical protein nbrc107696_41080 [Gordonia spumicola]